MLPLCLSQANCLALAPVGVLEGLLPLCMRQVHCFVGAQRNCAHLIQTGAQ